MKISRRTTIAGTAIATAAVAGGSYMALVRSGRKPMPIVTFQDTGSKRVVVANAIPDHPIGDFPNRHDPVSLRPQSLKLEIPLKP